MVKLSSAIAFGSVVLPTHQSCVLKLASPPFAVRVDVVNGEIVPCQLTATSRIRAGPACGSVPDYATLLGSETSPAVSSGEYTLQNSPQYLFALTALIHVIGHLGDS